jgi:hypothetical protein
MSQDGLHVLEAQLNAKAPPGLSALSDQQLRDLAGAIREARHRQASELAAAGDQALRYIPRLLRVPLRRVLG